MVTATALNTTVNLIDAAATVLKSEGASGAGKRVGNFAKDTVTANAGNVLRNRGAMAARFDAAGGPITRLTAQTSILSRMFIEEALLGEVVIPHLSKSVHEWYGAQIVSGLQLSQMVDSVRTVQDVMSIVQTGHNARPNGIIGNLAQRRMGQESFLSSYHGELFCSASSIALESLYGVESLASTSYRQPNSKHTTYHQSATIRDANNVQSAPQSSAEDKYSSTSVKSVKTSENRIGPMGELYELKMSNPNGNGQSITIPVFVQMQPSIIPTDIAPRFIDMNVPMSTWQRWTMRQAGELTFWKDFILHRDYARRQRTLLKDPAKAAAFSDYLRTIAAKDKYVMDEMTDSISSSQSANLANSVMILSEDTIRQAKLDSGIDLHNPADRQRYFKNTYTMILVIVDPLHQRVTTYFNGITGELNNSYTDYRPNTKDFNPQEFMAAMQAFSTNNIGRMR